MTVATVAQEIPQRASMVLNDEMPSKVDGIPLHPLLVHLPVVLVPLLVLLILAYVCIPPLRRRLGWAAVTLAVLVPVAVFFTRWTGEMLDDAQPATGALGTLREEHEKYGTWLLWLTIGILPVLLLFGALERGRRAARERAAGSPVPAPAPAPGGDDTPPPPRPDDDPASGGRRLVMIVLGVLLLAAAAASAYVVFKSGHTGATMVWNPPTS